jgi:hypothetical protein
VSPGKAPAVHYVGFGRPPASVVVTARDGVRLRARLVDPTGAALAGARVVLAAYVLDDNPKRHGFHHARWTQRLDRQGRLTALCAASGRSLDVFVEYQQRFHWVHSGPIRRDLDRGTITIGPGLPLTGILSDAVRQPFAAVDVSLVRVPDIEFDAAQLAVVFGTPRRLPALRCQSNSAGRFALPHLHPGRYALLCRGAAHPVLLQIVDLKAAVVDLRVAFPSGGTISGVVRNTDGEPMEGVTVFGRAARDSSNRSFLGWFGVGGMVATTDRRGRYRFLGLPTRERFRLQAHKVGYRDLDAARWNEGTAAVGSLIDFEIRRVE